MIPIEDVRRAMMYVAGSFIDLQKKSRELDLTSFVLTDHSALDIHPTPSELTEFISILDPEGEGYAIYSSFVAICALKFHSRTRTSDSHTQEVDEAFRLFTNNSRGDEEGKITLASLKRIAMALKEDVGEDLLRDMILEANGGGGVGKGVNKEEFESVMRRAGVWR